MDELIRKQDALDAFNGEITVVAARNAGRVYTYLKMATDRIKALPPVYVPDMNVGDMISRQAATTIPVMPKEHRHYQTQNLDDAYEQGWNDLQECIENLPPIQPKHGKWIPVTNGRGGHECDQCHNYAPSYQNGKEHLSDFCPYCGADMRGGKDG